MNEADFWAGLEFRVCREFAGMPERRLQSLWCDGFIPGEYVLDSPSPRITGRCWICNGRQQAEWEFALLLPETIQSRAQIDWATLLPPENVTQWMEFDERQRYIEIEPAAAVADRDERPFAESESNRLARVVGTQSDIEQG